MDKICREEVLRFSSGDRIKTYELLGTSTSNEESTKKISPLGEGGSGVVFKASQQLHETISITRAVKFFMYRDDIANLSAHKDTGPVSKDDFLSEIVNISSINHENVLKVIDAGVHIHGDINVPYIVTEFVNGPTLRDIIEGKSEIIKEKIKSNPSLFLEIILKIGYGLQHLHKRGFSHCDIAPKNIFLNETEDLKPVLGDLGIAKNIKRPKEKILLSGSRDYVPPEFLDQLNQYVDWDSFFPMHPRWDLFGYSKSCIEFLSVIDGDSPPRWLKAAMSCLNECYNIERYTQISELIERLEFLLPVHREMAAVPELSTGITGKSRRLMPVEAAQISRRFQSLVHHPALLRLTRVPQLSTTLMTFPGANHTRYEHSLGVFEAMRRYLMALIDQDEFLEHFSVEKIETALLCALFSNLTRFPISNVLHEIKQKNREQLKDFTKESLLSEIITLKDNKERTIIDLIEKDFRKVSPDNVQSIILGKKESFDNEDRVIHSLLNSSLDVRVMDFVRRDALHLGITEGDAVELEELLPHLTIHDHRLALRNTGVTVAEQIISLRYWLFNRIYWCKPNRSFCSMVRYLIMELIKDNDVEQRIRSDILRLTQRSFIGKLNKEAIKSGRADLLDLSNLLICEQQNLFRQITDICQAEDDDLVPAWRYVEKMSHTELKNLGSNIAESVLQFCFDQTEKEIVPLILDLPDEPGSNKLGDDILVVGREQKQDGLSKISGIVKGVNESFNNRLRRLRVFIHPSLYPENSKDREKLNDDVRSYLREL